MNRFGYNRTAEKKEEDSKNNPTNSINEIGAYKVVDNTLSYSNILERFCIQASKCEIFSEGKKHELNFGENSSPVSFRLLGKIRKKNKEFSSKVIIDDEGNMALKIQLDKNGLGQIPKDLRKQYKLKVGDSIFLPFRNKKGEMKNGRPHMIDLNL